MQLDLVHTLIDLYNRYIFQTCLESGIDPVIPECVNLGDDGLYFDDLVILIPTKHLVLYIDLSRARTIRCYC